MLRKSFMFLTVASVLVLSACNSNSAKSAQTTNPQADSLKKAEIIQPDAKVGNYSYFIAGMDSLLTDTALIKLSGNTGYAAYAKSMTENFVKIDKDRLGPMRDWAKSELNPNLQNKTLFYPFSGPDILHAVNFYPDADTYILMALELPGGFPDFDKSDANATDDYLNAVSGALSDVFHKSYFITKNMNKKVNFDADGTTPIICLFLARSGYQVIDIEKYEVLSGGSEKRLPDDSSITFNSNRYLVIHFQKDSSSPMKKLIYFSANICDDSYPGTNKLGLKKNAPLVAWLAKNTFGCNTYLKSASYLMHGNNYSIIRNLILKNSKTVLQDDTGIAFRFFDKKVWNFSFYGNYITPVKDFSSGTYQPDLRDAYAKDTAHVKKLSYSLGYHWQNQAGQNLMKAEKKN